MENLNKMIELAKNVDFSEEEVKTTGFILICVKTISEDQEANTSEKNLTCIAQGSRKNLLSGLSRAFEQDDNLANLMNEALLENRINSLANMIKLFEKLENIKNSVNDDSDNPSQETEG